MHYGKIFILALFVFIITGSLMAAITINYTGTAATIKNGGTTLADILLLNSVSFNGTDYFLNDCDILTCRVLLNITPAQSWTLSAGSKVSAKVTKSVNGLTSADAVYIREDTTEQYEEPVYKVMELNYTTTDNSTGKNTTVFYNGSVQTGTTTKTRPVTHWNTLNKGVSLSANVPVTVALDYKRSGVNDTADLVPNLFGVDMSNWAWWNATWQNKMQVNITNWTCTATFCQFPIPITLNATATNGTDIRILNSSETGELDFWRDDDWNYTNASGNIWVNASNQTSMVYIYYNASGVVDKSSIDATFIFGEDCSGTSLNTSKWTEENHTAGETLTIGGGSCNFTNPTTSVKFKGMTANVNFTSEATISLFSKINNITSQSDETSWIFLYFGAGGQGNIANGWFYDPYNSGHQNVRLWGTNFTLNTSYAFTFPEKQQINYNFNTSLMTGTNTLSNGTVRLFSTGIGMQTNTQKRVRLWHQGTGEQTFSVDYVFVTATSITTPSFVFGVQESELINTAPSMNTSRISPTTAYASSTLLGYCNATDADANNITYYFKWFLNGAANATGSFAATAPAVERNVANITSGLAKGQNWTLECKPDDGTVNGTAMNSSVQIISNSAPTAPAAPTFSAGTYKGDTFTVSACTATDADAGDSLTYTYQFETAAGAVLQAYGASASYTGCGANATCNKTGDIKAICQVTDGTVTNTSAYSSTTDILNTAPTTPTTPSVATPAGTAYKGDTFTSSAAAGSTDIDPEDSVSYTYQFLSGDGTVLQAYGANSYAGCSANAACNKTSGIKAQTRASDGTATNASTASATKAIANTAPTTPTTPTFTAGTYKADTFTLSNGAGSTDIDPEDSVSYTYQFENQAGDVVLQAYGVSASYTACGTTATCNKTGDIRGISRASDGTATNSSAYVNNDILNTAPTLPNVTDFADAATTHSFLVNGSVTDADGAADIAATNISASAGTCAQVSNSSAANIFKVQYNCTGTAPATATITIGFTDAGTAYTSNSSTHDYPDHGSTVTPPSVTAIIYNNSVATCTPGTYGDIDADTEDIPGRGYAWYLNGTIVAGENTSTFDLTGISAYPGDKISCSLNATNTTWTASYAFNMSANVTISWKNIIENASVGNFTNATASHSFLVNGSVDNADGGNFIVATNATASNGTCAYLANSSNGLNFQVQYNCTGGSLDYANVTMGFTNNLGNYTDAYAENTYPNQLPVMNTTRISPTTAYTTSTLLGYANATDIEGDSVQYNCSWIRNGTAAAAFNTTNYSQGVEVNVGNLTGFVVGENITLTCQAFDLQNGAWQNSSVLTISNAAFTNGSAVQTLAQANSTVSWNTTLTVTNGTGTCTYNITKLGVINATEIWSNTTNLTARNTGNYTHVSFACNITESPYQIRFKTEAITENYAGEVAYGGIMGNRQLRYTIKMANNQSIQYNFNQTIPDDYVDTPWIYTCSLTDATCVAGTFGSVGYTQSSYRHVNSTLTLGSNETVVIISYDLYTTSGTGGAPASIFAPQPSNVSQNATVTPIEPAEQKGADAFMEWLRGKTYNVSNTVIALLAVLIAATTYLGNNEKRNRK